MKELQILKLLYTNIIFGKLLLSSIGWKGSIIHHDIIRQSEWTKHIQKCVTKSYNLLDTVRGTSAHRTQYRAPGTQWTWRSSCTHTPGSRTLPNPTRSPWSVRWACHPPDSRADRWAVSACWRHCGHNNRWPLCRSHLRIARSLLIDQFRCWD